MKIPSRSIMILGAICLSIILSIGSFKFAKYQLSKKDLTGNIAVSSDVANQSLSETALEQMRLDRERRLAETSASSSSIYGENRGNITDTLARKIFVNSLSESGLSPEIAANQIASQIDTSKIPKFKFSLNQVQLFSPQGSADIRIYGNQFGEILDRNLRKIVNSKPKNSDDLTVIIKSHHDIGEELIKMKVPAAVAVYHLNVANSYFMLGDAFAIMNQHKKDPAQALLAINIARQAGTSLPIDSAQIRDFFIKSDIIFSKDEPGIFVTGYQQNLSLNQRN